jgi:hypothetical protein
MTLIRTESFVPLTAAPMSDERREFRVTVIPQSEQSRTFQSLEQLAPVPVVSSNQKKICEPRVSVQRDGDRVSSIRIQCSCGQVMDVACLYEEPAKS